MNSLAEVKNAKMQKMHSTIFPHTGARIQYSLRVFSYVRVCMCIRVRLRVCVC